MGPNPYLHPATPYNWSGNTPGGIQLAPRGLRKVPDTGAHLIHNSTCRRHSSRVRRGSTAVRQARRPPLSNGVHSCRSWSWAPGAIRAGPRDNAVTTPQTDKSQRDPKISAAISKQLQQVANNARWPLQGTTCLPKNHFDQTRASTPTAMTTDPQTSHPGPISCLRHDPCYQSDTRGYLMLPASFHTCCSAPTLGTSPNPPCLQCNLLRHQDRAIWRRLFLQQTNFKIQEH